MITEYRGYVIKNREDFKIQEIGESLTLFLFDPSIFEIDDEMMREFAASLSCETNAAFTILVSEMSKGIISLVINPTVEHYYTNEHIRDAITKFIFDHHIDDDCELDS